MGSQRVRQDWATELNWAPSWFNENILTNFLVSVLSLLLFSDHAYLKMSLFCFYYFYFLLRWHFWTVVLEKTLESPLDCQEIKSVNPKGNQSWIFIGRTVAEAETPTFLPPDVKKLTHWKRSWFWERLKAREGDDRGRDGWMASPTQWTWVWASSGTWWWTGRPGML